MSATAILFLSIGLAVASADSNDTTTATAHFNQTSTGPPTTVPAHSAASVTRSERQLGQSCDLSVGDKTTSPQNRKCGTNAVCQAINGCKSGVCICSASFGQLNNNPWDCFPALTIGDPCSPGNATQTQLMPEGANCNLTSKTVICTAPTRPDSGPCNVLSMKLTEAPGYNDTCDEKVSCSSLYQHQCMSDNKIAHKGRCDCPSYFYEYMGFCTSPGLDSLCENDDQCLRSYGPGSIASKCMSNPDTNENIFTKCRCNTGGNFNKIQFASFGSPDLSKIVSRCVRDIAKTRGGPGDKCSVGEVPVNGLPFCLAGLYCQRCPEFEDVVSGYCLVPSSAESNFVTVSHLLALQLVVFTIFQATPG